MVLTLLAFSLSLAQICGLEAKYVCAKCQKTRYCGAECQGKHWITHRHECNDITAVSGSRMWSDVWAVVDLCLCLCGLTLINFLA